MDTVRQQLKIFSSQYNLYMKSGVALQSNLISLTNNNELFTSPERSGGRQKWAVSLLCFDFQGDFPLIPARLDLLDHPIHSHAQAALCRQQPRTL